jgi:Mg2+/Co2+ transporter CorB
MKKIVVLLFVGLLLFGSMIPKLIAIFSSSDSEAGTVSSISTTAPSAVVSNEPAFKKEGELTFPKIQKKISIEIADNDAETTQGLMYRKSMPDTCGMLFVFQIVKKEASG